MKRLLLISLLSLLSFSLFSQDHTKKNEKIALEIINQASFCSLITVDENDHPEARLMQTLPVGDDFIIWLGTHALTNKLKQIINNPKVSVFYTEENQTGYVNIQGIAEPIYDKDLKDKHWKEGWEAYYQNKDKDFVLIKIIPKEVQMVSYAKGVVSNSENWAAEKIIFQ